MKFFFCISCLLFFANSSGFGQQPGIEYPVLKHYDQDHLGRIAMPVGGIGTGTLSIGGRGDIRQVEIMNIPGKQYAGSSGKNDLESISPVFCLYAKAGNAAPVTKQLSGPLEFYEYESMMGQPVENHGLPKFRHASFDAAYPFAQVNLSDETVPVDVKIKAFNPLIPADADQSGIPIVVLRFVLTNKTSKVVTASVCGMTDNFIGIDGSKTRKDFKGEPVFTGAKANRNEFRQEAQLTGIYMYSDSVDKTDAAWGTMALSTENTGRISYATSTNPFGSGSNILSFWDDFSADGILANRHYDQPDKPTAALAKTIDIPAHETREISFYFTWRFPNRYAWSQTIVGNYYAGKYADAWDVIRKTFPILPGLEKKTVEFVSAFINSDLPAEIKEAALFNISTLRTQTVFRTPDGKMFGWEGVFDKQGSCFGSCTHVWNYEQATAFLFGDLAKTMRDVEFGYSTGEDGKMCFRTALPLEKMKPGNGCFAAADGQMGTIMKMYREWQLSGDDNFLKTHWALVKKALSYAWIPKGWDSDRDGVMEGCQHNTMDVEYYGPNPQMQLWYLGALKAAEAMANYLHDKAFAAECRRIYTLGSAWTDKNLFNGSYYEQQIRPPGSRDNIAPSLIVGMGSNNFTDPEYQLGKGCLVDQLVGQYMAHICGLGYLTDSANIRTTLKSIMKLNYRSDMSGHFNHLRSFVFDDEAALLMAYYPSGRPEIPFPYFNEVMTGFEYVAAIGMIYEQQVDNGLLCIKNIRDRFDGRKRNPFDEIECGHHYARAMASWGAVPAITGFQYSAVKEEMHFNAKQGKWFWSNGYAWGVITIKKEGNEWNIAVEVLKGKIKLKKFILGNETKAFKKAVVAGEKQPLQFSMLAGS